MVKRALEYIYIFEKEGFRDMIVSLKSSEPYETLKAYRLFASKTDYPIHLGITATGKGQVAKFKSAMVIGTLLMEGIGDTLRVSLTGAPHEEVKVGKDILEAAGIRKDGPQIISCPTCGRCEIDLVSLVDEVTEATKDMKNNIFIAIMGCVVNGPGECEGADVAIFAGKGRGIIYVQGEQTQTVTEDRMLDALLHECRELAAKVQRGEAKLIGAHVEVKPPDPLPRKGGSVPLSVVRQHRA
jgi:(E)-4-hydroxy-3-methylbut-2-enyl-diphosphate synthase